MHIITKSYGEIVLKCPTDPEDFLTGIPLPATAGSFFRYINPSNPHIEDHWEYLENSGMLKKFLGQPSFLSHTTIDLLVISRRFIYYRCDDWGDYKYLLIKHGDEFSVHLVKTLEEAHVLIGEG